MISKIATYTAFFLFAISCLIDLYDFYIVLDNTNATKIVNIITRAILGIIEFIRTPSDVPSNKLGKSKTAKLKSIKGF
jgi:hypothetical protein